MLTEVLTYSCSAQSNADVPLLRLPAELRNRIWVFAMGGQQVILPSSPTQKGAAVRLPAVTHLRVTHLIVRTVRALRFSHPVSLAFRLPEVSRQIYSETVLTAYSENTFIYDTAHWTYRNATTRLMIAQRRAIVSIEPDPQTFSTMVLPSRHHGNVWRKRLPNVRTIFVTALALKKCSWPGTTVRILSRPREAVGARNNGGAASCSA